MRPVGFHDLPYSAQLSIRRSEFQQSASNNEVRTWREKYETLVKQTGRQIDDGLGIDPRATQPATPDPPRRFGW